MRLRFPPMAVRCPHCKAAAGDLCTNQRGNTPRRSDTHDARRITWVITTTTCPECQAAPGNACFANIRHQRVPLPDVHTSRETAAHRAQTTSTRPSPT
ncbi:zinc finger domain-containing protein [Streptomyces chryseus]